MKLHIRRFQRPQGPQLPFEVVERKGAGHPDSLCDSIAETISNEYTAYCYERFGRPAHHWFDKVMLLGGSAELDYGHGRIVDPYTVVVAGKAVTDVGTTRIPLEKLATTAIRSVFAEWLRGFDPDHNLRVELRTRTSRGPGQVSRRYRPMSQLELIGMGEQRVANDGCVCAAYWPLSHLEEAVLAVERELNSPEYRSAHPHTGSDVKVFGRRIGEDVRFSVNIPLIAREVSSRDVYLDMVREIEVHILALLRDRGHSRWQVEVNPEKSAGRSYLTVTGSVADTGDVGVVGRGNRYNGLITPMRPMSIEAAAGKNPIDHVGKLYSMAAQELARRVAHDTGGSVCVYISTEKERSIDNPETVLVEIMRDENSAMQARIASSLEEVLAETLETTKRPPMRVPVVW